MEFFREFSINRELGVLTWGDGEVDIAPETLYAEATKSQLPDWMDPVQESGEDTSLQSS